MLCCVLFFFFKQKTAYEMRISDWSSDVCSSDLLELGQIEAVEGRRVAAQHLGRLVGGDVVEHLGDLVLGVGVAAFVVGVVAAPNEIGRASCRERVCQYV